MCVSIRRRTALAVSGTILAGALIGCGDAGEPRTRVALGPGVSLLDALGSARLRGVPGSNLTPAVARWLGRAPRTTIEAGAWGPGKTLDAESFDQKWYPMMMGLAGKTLQRWRAVPALRPDMPLGSVELRHEERLITTIGWHGTEVDPDRDRVWWDADARLAFWWDAAGGGLLAFGERAPGDVELAYVGERDLLSRYERAADVEAVGRVGRFLLDDVSRPALLLPAPGSLELDLPAGGGPGGEASDGLRLAVGLPDHGFAEVDGALLAAPGASDGVTFVVEVEDDAGTHELWRRHLSPGEGWVRAHVAWPEPWAGSATVRLRSEPGPAADAAFDYALWADLRLTGPVGADPRPHLLLIDIDTLRADRIGPAGAARDTTPRLDAWARQHAVVYTDALATAPWTVPSTLSILTGLDVLQHGVTHRKSMRTDLVSVAARLRAAGYETVAETGGGYLVPTFGFDAGFDSFRWRVDMDGSLDGAALLEALDERRGPQPVFAFLHTYMVHAPYLADARFDDPAEPYTGPWAGQPVDFSNLIDPHKRGLIDLGDADRAYVERMYDAGVARMDAALGAFLDGWFARVPHGSTAVVLTSDHGEELFEHGLLNHGHSLHGELLRVPLVVEWPRLAQGETARPPGIESRPVSTLDVVPTLLQLAGVAVPADLPGHSLLAELPDERVRIAVLGGTDGDDVAAVTFRDGKLIQDGRGPRLYRLSDDPGELRDIAERNPSRVRDLESLLEQYRARYPPLEGTGEGLQLDAETEASLRALGYLGGDG